MKPLFSQIALIALGIGLCSPSAAAAQGIGAFADVGYTTTTANGANDHFSIGAMDLYANRHISARTNVFFELVFENDGEAFVVDVERYWIMRELNPALKVGAGRFHAPLGHWNRNYHHGILIQNTASRPAFLDFEDGDAAIMPMHGIGMMATGDIGTGFAYQINLANSNSYDTSGGAGSGEILLGNVSDNSAAKTVIGRVTYSVERTPLTLGVFGMNNDLVETSASGTMGAPLNGDLAHTNVWGGDIHFDNDIVEFLAEYYGLSNTDKTGGIAGGDGTGTAYYVQVSYRTSDRFQLTYRYEDLSLDSNVGYFNILGTEAYSAHVGAVRYDVDDSSALKFEYRLHRSDTGTDVTEVSANWSFMVF